MTVFTGKSKSNEVVQVKSENKIESSTKIINKEKAERKKTKTAGSGLLFSFISMFILM